MNSIFFIQYDPNTHNLTHITSDNMFGNNNWTPVAISYAYQQYVQNHYQNMKYDSDNKALQYPFNVSNDVYLANNNQDITTVLNNNQKDINNLKYKIAWNHVMSVFKLPDDLAFLNKNYSIPMNNQSLSIANFTKTGIYVVPPYANLPATDGPQNVNYNDGYTFKIYPINTNEYIAKFINSLGIWVNEFNNNNEIINNWTKRMSF